MVGSSFCRQCLVRGVFFALQSNIHAFCLRVVVACAVDIVSAWLSSPLWQAVLAYIQLYKPIYMCIHGVSSSGHHWVIIGSLLGHHLVIVGSLLGRHGVIVGSSLSLHWVIVRSSFGHRPGDGSLLGHRWVLIGSLLGHSWVAIGSSLGHR